LRFWFATNPGQGWTIVAFATLKKRSEFLRLRGGARCATPSFVVETKPRPVEEAAIGGPRFGFTVTKQMGGAVKRNRIKRRLRAAVQLTADQARASHDYVLIARVQAFDRPFEDIKRDLERALQRVHQPATPQAKRR
jgi:ribonuclease P protein component